MKFNKLIEVIGPHSRLEFGTIPYKNGGFVGEVFSVILTYPARWCQHIDVKKGNCEKFFKKILSKSCANDFFQLGYPNPSHPFLPFPLTLPTSSFPFPFQSLILPLSLHSPYPSSFLFA